MKCGLLSLALLGTTPASGCWLRNSADGTRTELEGANWAHAAVTNKELIAGSVTKELVVDESAKTARAKRIHGKRALAKACSDNKHFSECSQNRGSAVLLERCLRAKQTKLSPTCQRGLQTW